MLNGLKTLFVISYDAYADATLRLATTLHEQQVDMRFLVMTQNGKQVFPDAMLKRIQALGDVAYVDHEHVADALVKRDESVMFLFFAGLEIERCIRALHAAHARPPVCITCFAGVLLDGPKAGFPQRLTSDIMLINSRTNLREYQDFCQTIGADASNALLFGFPALLRQPVRTDLANPPRHVLYIDQTIIPASREDRLVIARGLLSYARHFPDRTLKVLLRDSPTNRSAHPGLYTMDELIAEAAQPAGVPDNLIFSAEGAASALDTCDLCVGMSSAALIHSMARGIPTALLQDVGWSATLGNTLFTGSGMESSFAQLLRDELPPAPYLEWLAETVSFPQDNLAAMDACIQQKHAQQHRPLCNDRVAKGLFLRTLLKQRIRKMLRPLKPLLKRFI